MISSPPPAHTASCHTHACWHRVKRHRRAHWLRRFPLRWAVSTSYCPGSSGSTTADGSTVHLGVVAMNSLPLETTIRFEHEVLGRHRFVVRDRIGAFSDLDIWSPSCSWSSWWGRRRVSYRVMP